MHIFNNICQDSSNNVFLRTILREIISRQMFYALKYFNFSNSSNYSPTEIMRFEKKNSYEIFNKLITQYFVYKKNHIKITADLPEVVRRKFVCAKTD